MFLQFVLLITLETCFSYNLQTFVYPQLHPKSIILEIRTSTPGKALLVANDVRLYNGTVKNFKAFVRNLDRFYIQDVSQNTSFELVLKRESDVLNKSIVNTSLPNPLTNLLISNASGIYVKDLNESRYSIKVANSKSASVSYMSTLDAFFWLENDVITMKKSSSHPKQLCSVSKESKDLNSDWISQYLYWSTDYEIHFFDLEGIDYHTSEDCLHTLLVEFKPFRIVAFQFDPWNNNIYAITEDPASNKNSLSKYTIGKEVETIYQLVGDGWPRRKECTCYSYRNEDLGESISFDSVGKRIYFVIRKFQLFSTDSRGCDCEQYLRVIQPPFRFQLFAIANGVMFWKNKFRHKSLQKFINGHEFNIPIKDEITFLGTYGPHLQMLPPLKCLMPSFYNFSIYNIRNTSVLISINETDDYMPSCGNIFKPTVLYVVNVTKLQRSTRTYIDTYYFKYSRIIEISYLHPYTSYIFDHFAENFFSKKYNIRSNHHFLKVDMILGVPSKVRSLTATALTDKDILLTWLTPNNLQGPHDAIKYLINVSSEKDYVLNCSYTKCNIFNHRNYFIVSNLSKSEKYTMQVSPFYFIHSKGSSMTTTAKTFSNDVIPQISNVTNTTFLVTWHPVEFPRLSRLVIIVDSQKYIWHSKDEMTLKQIFKNRRPYSKQIVSYVFIYNFNDDIFLSYFNKKIQIKRNVSFRMKASVPSQVVNVNVTRSNKDLSIVWDIPAINSFRLRNYLVVLVKGNKSDESIHNVTSNKFTLYNLPYNSYEIRVSAVNDVGQGLFSDPVKIDVFQEINKDNRFAYFLNNELVLFGIFITGIAAVAICLVFCYCLFRRCQCFSRISNKSENNEEKALLSAKSFLTQDNMLYYVGGNCGKFAKSTLSGLRVYHRTEIETFKTIGSGAFGNVFSGSIKCPLMTSEALPSAIKVLRCDADDHREETENFLKEGILLSNLSHSNIVKIMGVCLKPVSILMELMTDGDLLTYLRKSRSNPPQLKDKLDIGLQISQGCEYLEMHHLVHRDLAARNCLIGKNMDGNILVKLGDFGLARNLYSSTYYRKTGEGLLPIRWMAPESIVDGIFTSHTDVWSFGILFWEVLTLGEQPYPGMGNVEVLEHVRNGGYPSTPPICTPLLNNLLVNCWRQQPEERPTFKVIHEKIEQIVVTKEYEYPISLHSFDDDGTYNVIDGNRIRNCPSSQPLYDAADSYIAIMADKGDDAINTYDNLNNADIAEYCDLTPTSETSFDKHFHFGVGQRKNTADSGFCSAIEASVPVSSQSMLDLKSRNLPNSVMDSVV